MRPTPPRQILEINCRVWIRNLGLGSSPSLRDIPDRELDSWQQLGFDAIWLMGVWLPSPKAHEMALKHAGLHGEYIKVLPDLRDEDVTASPYAIRGYLVNPEWGGNEAMLDFKARLHARDMRLILDFIPNHVGRDHPWIYDHPDWFVSGHGADFHKAPHNWFFAETRIGERIIAHGKDPYFDGWSDTAQLDYRNFDLQQAQIRELLDIAPLCDGVRCDMAMLVTSDIFKKTWGVHSEFPEFWPRAIQEVKSLHPGFCFMAEAYWGTEPLLIQQGFDLCYDKEHLDRVVSAKALTQSLFDQPTETHRHHARFLENHDEPRIASRLDPKKNLAAAVWTFSLPGTSLLYDGQIDGMKIRIPVQLLREPHEAVNPLVKAGYTRLLTALKHRSIRSGEWKLLAPRTAWMGNETHGHILGAAWDSPIDSDSDHVRVFVNWSDSRSQCWVDVTLGNLAAKEVVLSDKLTEKVFVRNGVELMMRGFYLDMEPYEAHIFDCTVRANAGLTLE